MVAVDRRTFLRGAAVAAGGAVLGGPFQGFVARSAAADPGGSARGELRADPGPARRRGPAVAAGGFQYRSFHDTEFPVVLDDGTTCPAGTTAWRAFGRRNGNVLLVRNHEVNGPGRRSATPARRTTRWRGAAPRRSR